MISEELRDKMPVTLDEQVMAYDLLDAVLAVQEAGLPLPAELAGRARAFCSEHGCDAARYDEAALKQEAAERLKPLQEKLEEARFEAAAAASLHEFAKETFEVWQTSGVFARRRALRELRERAGFRLESHRIGNYVAKTFDLMNEAQARFAQAQQAVFSADVTYKIRPGVHQRLFECLEHLLDA